MLTPEEKLSRSKSKLLLSQPFYGVLLTSTNITANKDIPTAATNGIDIMYKVYADEKLIAEVINCPVVVDYE